MKVTLDLRLSHCTDASRSATRWSRSDGRQAAEVGCVGTLVSRTEFGHSDPEVVLWVGLIALLLSIRHHGPATLVAHYLAVGKGYVYPFLELHPLDTSRVYL